MSGIKDAKKKRARRRRKRQIQRILLIIAMVLILIGFIFLVRAAIRTVVNKFTVPAVTTSVNKTAGTKSTAGKHKTKKKSASKKKTSTKNTSPKADSSKRAVQLETVTISKKIQTRFLLLSVPPETVHWEPMKISVILPA